VTLIGSLVALALIDSTSFGTLLIPVWMMLAPGRLRKSRILLFLVTVAACYLVIGVALLAGATALLDAVRPVFDSTAFRWVQLVVGLVMLVGSFFGGRRRGGQPGRLLRWRERALAEDGSARALVWVAVAAVGIEAASMLPYLGALGLLGASGLSFAQSGAVLAGYCLVMILPALVLLAVRAVASGAMQGALERLDAWITRSASGTTWWIVAIIGFLVARDAATALGLLDFLAQAGER
jgi:hypothetical protein